MGLVDAGAGGWDDIRRTFSWRIPPRFNIAAAICNRHRERGDAIALYCENERGVCERVSFARLDALSNRLANVLRGHGLAVGDRVGIVLPQRAEAAIAHLAVYKCGALALPLSVLFGADALEYRLRDSGARVVITDAPHRDAVEALAAQLPELEHLFDCDDATPAGLHAQLERAGERFRAQPTRADDPALLIYTSGTTGPPKGAVVPHRALLGNLTGFELSHDFFPQPGDLFWTPADWAWTGGLMDALLPSLFYGVPVLGYAGGKFDPEKACRLMAKYGVRNAFIPPTALKMIRQQGDVRARFGLALRTIMSAGESVGAELYHWAHEALGVRVNEMWGQTEFNYVVGNGAAVMDPRPGSMGKPYPGHRVEPVDEQGNVVADNEVGELAAWREDPVMFLGYWRNEAATRAKCLGPWWCTGDVGYRDEDGYLWFVGRKDDVISSAGYRVGPGEIEDCLLKHPAVAQAAVIGVPDSLRGEIIKAFIVVAAGHEPGEALAADIRARVRERLAAYEYPREIEFIDELPLTTTGKVRRVELRRRERERSPGGA